jgi:hypothetical protein
VRDLDLSSLVGSYVRLVVTGTTLDGCSFLATDCVRVQ